jgi:hypothetical protein
LSLTKVVIKIVSRLNCVLKALLRKDLFPNAGRGERERERETERQREREKEPLSM